MTYRRPPVTSMSIHSAGHFFAVGYEDGCIAFWAVEDEDQPLQVRTLDDSDVNVGGFIDDGGIRVSGSDRFSGI